MQIKMQINKIWSARDRWGLPALWVLLVIVTLTLFGGAFASQAGILAALFAAYLLATQDLRPLRCPLVWPLFAYVIFAGLTVFWAMAGKFHLREYLKIFTAAAICLYMLLKPRFDRESARRAASLIAGTSAVSAFLSVEGATSGLTSAILKAIPRLTGIQNSFAGVRLFGIYGNSNFEATVFAFGVFFSLALLCGAKTKREKIAYAVTLAFSAYGLLLGFSMGAIGCFALSIVCYLFFAGSVRSAALVRMLEGAVPTLVLVMLAFPFFNRPGFLGVVPLLVMVLDAAIVALLELRLAPKLVAVLESRQKLAFGFLIGVLALVVVYAVAGLSVHGAYTFGNALSRSVYPQSIGEHVLTVNADGDVEVTVSSRTRVQIMIGESDELYSGPANGARFTVPENSEQLLFTFSGASGTTLRSASLDDGAQEIPLSYPLLPAFAADRMQGLRANTNFITRLVYMEDGIKLWRLSPIVGLGIGAFETGYSRVQQMHYGTRYVHNHYIQTLLETGVIGCAFWVAALISMGVALWLRRRDRAAEYGWLYGALWAALIMSVTQSVVDVSFSFYGFLFYAYTLFGLILRLYAVPEEKLVTEETESGKTLKKSEQPKEHFSLGRIFLIMIPLAYALSLGLNLWADKLVSAEVESLDQYFSNVALAAKVDVYEYNDAKLSYVSESARWEVSSQTREKADAYAEELARVQSNSIPIQLTAYYLNTGRDEKSIDAAMLSTIYNASDSGTWNEVCSFFRQAFGDPVTSPLLLDGEVLVQKLLEYRTAYLNYNANAIQPVVLNEENAAFLDKIARLDPYPNDIYKVAEILRS